MITKLLLTLLVIIGAVLVLRIQAGKRPHPRLSPPATPAKSPRSRVFFFIAAVLLLLSLAATVYYLWYH
jgi:hypothetical protein